MVKTAEEIEKIRKSGALLARTLAEVVQMVKPGVTTGELDAFAERRFREAGGEPSFLGYKTRVKDPPYPSTLCTSINDEVVHAPATPARTLKDGDIIGLDIGVRLDGYCSDMAVTVAVGSVDKPSRQLMQVTRESLMRGLSVIRPGALVSDIGRAVQTCVESNGFSVVRDLVGHGIGKGVHEDPRIPNYVDRRLKPVVIEEGMCLCIEPMVNVGGCEVYCGADEWTIATTDASRSAHFEVTIVVTKKGFEILTPLPV